MVRALVRSAGGSPTRASMIATVTTELAQNIVLHAAGNGEITAWLEAADIVVRARDWGSLGAVGRRGLGQGQASVRRMMDRVQFDAPPEGGLIVTARARIEREGHRPCR